MSAILREIQLAAELGYCEMADFRAALRRKEVPEPTRFLDPKRRRRPVWTRAQINAWLDPKGDAGSSSGDLDIDAILKSIE